MTMLWGDHASWPCDSSERLPWTQCELVTSRPLADGCGCDMLARPTSAFSSNETTWRKRLHVGPDVGSRSDLGRCFPH